MNSFQIKQWWDGIVKNKVGRHLDDTEFMLSGLKAIRGNLQMPKFYKD
jgi:hypothetical protein